MRALWSSTFARVILGATLMLHAPAAAHQSFGGVDDFLAIQAVWHAADVQSDGKANPEAIGSRFSFSGETLTVKHPRFGEPITAKFTLDPTKKPRELTWTGEFMGEKFIVRAIYRFEKGSIRYCAVQQLDLSKDATERPKEFRTAIGDGRTLVILKREIRP